MSWRQLPIDKSDLEKSYTEKYGLNSPYQSEQEAVYNHPQILPYLTEAISWLKLEPGMTVLDIGVNNGYELELFQKVSLKPWPSDIAMIGFDVIGEVLSKARERFNNSKNYHFIKGDITKFKGVNVADNSQYEVQDNSVDVVLALTSLQSTSIVANFDSFMETLLKKLKSNSQVIVGTPNFHAENNGMFAEGLFDANTQSVDLKAAPDFSKKLADFMKVRGFDHQQTGRAIIFDYFSK